MIRTRLMNEGLCHSLAESWTYRSVDGRDCGYAVHDAHRDGLELTVLAASRGNPAHDDGVASVDTRGESAHGKISHTGVQGCACQDKAHDGDGFGDGDVPNALIVTT
jgi:hypothetical protein